MSVPYRGATPASASARRNAISASQNQISLGLAVADDCDGGKTGDRLKVHPFDELRQCHRLNRW
jgi:hypothetical protein